MPHRYSNWPTFPQLYVDGELVGGLDIIKVCVISAAAVRTVAAAVMQQQQQSEQQQQQQQR